MLTLLHDCACCAAVVVLRSRLAMLSAAAEAYRHAQTQLRFSCIMCVDVAGVRLMEAAAARCRDDSALFPEHRYVAWDDEPEHTTQLSCL